MILAIDPGPTESAFVLYDGENICLKDKVSNDDALQIAKNCGISPHNICAIEKIESMGMAVGAEVFETVYWSGRLAQAFGPERVVRIPRRAVKLHLCNSMQAKDANIRRALIDKFGGDAEIKKGGKLYRVSGDEWSALAVAITYWEKERHR